jgi:Zn-dependent protease/CBS domain-containing protein
MMRGSFNVGRILGIQIGINYTWVFALVLFSWLFARGTFPVLFPGWSISTYWIAGIVMSIMLFVSVLIHELCHSLVARSRGMKVNSIVLFIFGGVSNIQGEPERPWVEFIMAGAGPASSLILGAIFALITYLVRQSTGQTDTPLLGVLFYLAYVNVLLAIFNIIPGFPMDGGRVLRSIIWGATHSLHISTMIAGNIGRFFGWALILFGVANFFGVPAGFGSPLNGLWAILVGWFLLHAADSSLRDLSLQEHLAGKHVGELMDRRPECVNPETFIETIVHGSFIQGGRRALPVCNDSGLLGIVTLSDVKKIPKDAWSNTPVQTIMTPGDKLLTVNQSDDLNTALAIMAQNGLNQIPVMGDGRLVGLLTRADVLRFLHTHQQFATQDSSKPTISA